MQKINKINYHITNKCNYSCKYCFGKFNCKNPSLENAKHIIDNCNEYFISNNIADKYINFAGGEPLTYKYLDDLIDYCVNLNIKVSIITNASLLSIEQINKWKNKVYCIGISIDSFNDDTNINIGRCHNNNVLSIEKLKIITDCIHKNNIKLKINTVVSKYNLNEDFKKYYLELSPYKIKFLKMHIVKNINESTKEYSITENEFLDFCEINKIDSCKIVIEKSGYMENAYVMINPSGWFIINNNGNYEKYCNCNIESLTQKIKNTPIDINKFNKRYNDGDINE